MGINRSSKNWHKLRAEKRTISLSDSDEGEKEKDTYENRQRLWYKSPEKVQKRMLDWDEFHEMNRATRLPLPTPAPAPMKAKVFCRNKSHLSTCPGVGPGCQRSLCRGSPPETKAKAPDSQPTSSTATSATQAMATATKNPLLAPEKKRSLHGSIG